MYRGGMARNIAVLALFSWCGLLAEDGRTLEQEAAHASPERRRRAFATIEKFDAGSARIVSALLDGLFDEDYEVGRAALRAVARLGGKALGVARALEFVEGHALLMGRAREALPGGGAAPADDAAAQALDALAADVYRARTPRPGQPAVDLVALLDRRPYLRMLAVRALRAQRIDAPFVAMFKHTDPRRRRLAAQMCSDVTALRRGLTDGDALVRRASVASLMRVRHRPGAAAAVPDLAKLLDAPDVATRRAVLMTLGYFGVPAHGVAPRMAAFLSDEDPDVRGAAASALESMRVADPSLVMPLVRALHDEKWWVVRSALNCLRTMGPVAKKAAPHVVRLADAWPTFRGHAPAVLRSLGGGAPLPPRPKATAQAELVAGVLTGQSVAAFSLGRMQGEVGDAALDALRDAMGHDDPILRRHAALALVRLAPRSIDRLAEVVRSGPLRARRLALLALEDLASGGNRIPVDDVRGQLGSDDAFVRHAAIGVFTAMPSPPRELLPLMLRLVDDRDPEVSRRAVYALGRLRAPAAVPKLVSLLATWEDQSKAWMAVDALKAIGVSAAESAVPAILAAAREPNGPSNPAVPAFVELGPRGHKALAELVMDGKPYSRLALETLARKGLRPPNLREAIDFGLRSKDAWLRRIASEIPAPLAPGSPDPASVFEALAKDSQPHRSPFIAQLAKDADPAAILPFVDDARLPVRQAAWLVLGRMDSAKFPAALRVRLRPKMVAALKDENVSVRYAVIAVWLRVPPERVTPDALRLLASDFARSKRKPLLAMLRELPSLDLAIRALGHHEAVVRRGACYLIADYGKEAASAVPRLTALARSDPKLRQACAFALDKIGPAASVGWLRIKAQTEQTYRFVRLVKSRGVALLPQLQALLDDDEVRVRHAAVAGLAVLGKPAATSLWKAVKDGDASVQRAALGWLARMPSEAERVVPYLLRPGADTRQHRRWVTATLKAIGAKAGPALLKAVDSEDKKLRLRALQFVPAMGGVAAVPVLRRGLADEDDVVRRRAAVAAASLGADAVALLPDLRARLSDVSPEVRAAAMDAIGAMGEKGRAGVPDLIRLLKIGSAHDRAHLPNVFRRLGACAVPSLLELFGSRDKELQEVVRKSLAMIGRPAVSGIIAVLGSTPREELRREAGDVLRRIGTSTIGPFIKLLAHKSADVRRNAAWRLGQFKRDAFPAVPELTKLLRDHADEVASQAAWSLGQIGPGADTALPELERLLRAGRFVAICRDAIRRIRGR